jgi:hypothetical protein
MASVKKRRVASKSDKIGAAVHLLYDCFHLVDRTNYVIEFEAARRADWSSQGLVETPPAGVVSSFELLRTQPSEMAVTSGPIVERVDVGSDLRDRQFSVLVDLLLDSLLLQAAEERFGDGVVPAVALSAHAGLEMIRPAEAAPRIAPELGAPIGVNQSAARSPTPHSH